MVALLSIRKRVDQFSPLTKRSTLDLPDLPLTYQSYQGHKIKPRHIDSADSPDQNLKEESAHF